MKTPRAVVLGAGGLLGQELVRELRRRERDVRGFDRASCSITDEARVAEAVADATHVYNAAAYTNVDGAEREPDAAFAANALGPELIARATARTGATLVHVSTDFVFDGLSERPCDEFDLPRPQSLYARSKRAGELLVAAATPRHHLVRVQGLYGDGGRNFSSKLRELLRAGKTGLRIDCERRVQPTWARSAARALVDIGESDRFGTWHAVCGGATTWHDFTARMAAHLGLAPTWEPVASSSLTLPAPRPPSCLLENRRLALYGMAPLPSWQDALDGYLAAAAARDGERG